MTMVGVVFTVMYSVPWAHLGKTVLEHVSVRMERHVTTCLEHALVLLGIWAPSVIQVSDNFITFNRVYTRLIKSSCSVS